MAIRGGQAPVTPTKRRVWALVLLGCGLVLAKFSLYDPVAAAGRHEATVSFSLRNAAFAVFAVILALLFIAVSFLNREQTSKFNRWATNPETKRMTNGKAITAAVILTIVCFVVAFLVQTHIHNAGYDV